MRTLFLLLISFLFVSFSSCSIYEDVYFQTDGSVKYQMMIDASELSSITSSLSVSASKNMPTDSIISFADIIKDSINIPNDLKSDLKNIEPLFMKLENDLTNSKFNISIYGTFDSSEAYNNAFTSMAKLQEYVKKDTKTENPSSSLALEKINNGSLLSWDGTIMKRTIVNELPETDFINQDNDEAQDINSSFDPSRLLSKSRMIVKYHFPEKIEAISNPNAVLSQDGKTAIIEYSGSVLTKATKELSIEISTKK